MLLRFAAALVALSSPVAGCAWDGRPDGGSPRHTDDRPDPLTRAYDQTDPVQPLDDGTVVEPLAGTSASASPDAMPLAPGSAAPAGAADAASVRSGSASGDGAATGRGPAAPGSNAAPSPR